MGITVRLPLLLITALALVGVGWTSTGLADTWPAKCTPDPSWFGDPTKGSAIKAIDGSLGRGHPCYFHGLAWQWFLHLMHPSSLNPNLRNFEDSTKYAVLGRDVCPQCPDKETTPELSGWFIRNVKESSRDPQTDLFPFRLADSNTSTPLSICSRGGFGNHQPGSAIVLHDQFGKVVYFRTLYKRNLCNVYGAGGRRIAGERILEIKLSWRQIGEAEKRNYIHQLADLPVLGRTLIGLVGLHVAIDSTWNTSLIWATFEHRLNTADCEKPIRDAGWSFTSAACAKCLRSGTVESCGQVAAPCDNINVGYARTGTPASSVTHVCRAHPDAGTDQTNMASIKALNKALVEPNGLLTKLAPDHPMAVLKNYFHVGTLWLLPDTDSPHSQQSSRFLANTSLESFQQENNCFSCHRPSGSANSYPMSHILPPGPRGK